MTSARRPRARSYHRLALAVLGLYAMVGSTSRLEEVETYRDVLRDWSGQLAEGPIEADEYHRLAQRLFAIASEEEDEQLRYRAWIGVLLLEESGGETLRPEATAAVDAIIDHHADDPEVVVPFVKRVLVDDRFDRVARLLEVTESEPVEAACSYAQVHARVHSGAALTPDAKAAVRRDIEARIERFGALEDPTRDGAVWSQAFEELVERMEADLYEGAPLGDFEAADLAGEPVSASDCEGRVVLLSFWSSTCVACIGKFPREKELALRFADRRFTLLGVNPGDTLETARSVATRHDLPWRTIAGARATELATRLDVEGLPCTFLVDREGRLQGFDLEPLALDRRIRDLLADGSNDRPND